jgi:hypothetical protein
MDHEQDFDDGLVHNHAWATEPPIPPQHNRLAGPPDTMLIPTPSTVYRDDQAEG